MIEAIIINSLIALLTLGSSEYDEGEFSTDIIGEVTNNGTEDLTFVQITATLYDESDSIVGSDFTFTDPTNLAAGQTGSFDVLLSAESTDGAATYTLRYSTNEDESGTLVEKQPID